MSTDLLSARTIKRLHPSFITASATRINNLSVISSLKKGWKSPRRLITISTANGKFDGEWNCEYRLSLRDLQLTDLVEDDQQHNPNNTNSSQVSINLCIQKHASFGLSVDGRIITSFIRKCSICSTPYLREIDTKFNVWFYHLAEKTLQSKFPEIGGDDSIINCTAQVIYVKPGSEANLDSLVQDAIRLTTSAKDTCSESCENSEPTLQFIGGKNNASVQKRWSRLLELRKGIQ
ncbi:large ribosomal RNA subunit accumulation protein YCED homolog 2, chloroplastic-like [Rutidosis leptorrhynchoides]|uniref:large ribosomal RNA subunit accumulation protein YCED homolog 2, chloroplastic-like n=1 Tax=Rutidosis leptorrhynchoides TaxID=125765 RepID=UPI003A99B5AE